jgi:uncharacterized lipoprotein YddW (UPF0748 family)
MFDADPVKGKEQVRVAVRRLAEAHFNLILPWTTSGYLVALDHPEYLAFHPTARWDALGVLVDEASRAGLAVHLWYAFSEDRSRNSPDFDPRVGGNPEWAARRIRESVPDPRTGKVMPCRWDDVCPLHPEARQWQGALLGKTFQRYPALKGIHIEEPGYDNGQCVCDLCLKVFPEIYGKPLPESIRSFEADDFRAVGTTAFMSGLYHLLQKDHPHLVFSTNGDYDWPGDRMKGRNWASWAGLGWLNYYVPQVYMSDVGMFRRGLGSAMKILGQRCTTYAGIGVRWDGGTNSAEQIVSQIEAAREMGAGGVVLFSGDAVSDELFHSLVRGPFRLPASFLES